MTADPFRVHAALRALGRPALAALALSGLFLGSSPDADAAAARTVLRGQTDQNQPLRIRLHRRPRAVRVRLSYLTHCHRGPEGASDPEVVDFARSANSPRWFRLGRKGGFEAKFRLRRRRRGDDADGGVVELRSSTLVRFWGRVRRDGSAAGGLRVRTVTRELIDDTENPLYWQVSRCHTRTRRWRVPRIRFSGPWRPTGPMIAPRSGGALLPLAGGRLLLAGSSDLTTASSEVYGARSNHWRRAGRLPQPLAEAATARLADGRVLLTGGRTTADLSTRDSSLFDPRTRSWSGAAPMHDAREGHTATLLADGRVLVVGGFRLGPEDDFSRALSAELYDPGRNAWSFAAPPPPPTSETYGSGAAFYSELLPSGKVLVVGDWDAEEDDRVTSTVYDPSSNSWTPRTRVPLGGNHVDQFAVTRLADGRVLVVAGCLPFADASAAVFGPDGWSAVRAPAHCSTAAKFALASLPSGRALLADTRRALIYDPAGDRWARAPRYRFPHLQPQVSPAPGGALVVDAGLNRFSSSERFFERGR